MKIPIHECFQATIQGEGVWTGTPVDFIRLQGCPIACYFCDSGYADGGKNTPRTMRDINEVVAETRSPRVVISGGEPFVQRWLPALVQALVAAGKFVHIETSGAFWQDIPNAWITLSPKTHVSPEHPVDQRFWRRANEIKLVISTGEELQFYRSLLTWSECPIYLQPEWNERDRTLPLVLDLLRQNPRYRLSVQLHKYLGVQ